MNKNADQLANFETSVHKGRQSLKTGSQVLEKCRYILHGHSEAKEYIFILDKVETKTRWIQLQMFLT